MAQAARAVLQNSSQVNQMLSDLNKVDFANVQDQVYEFSKSVNLRKIDFFVSFLGWLGLLTM